MLDKTYSRVDAAKITGCNLSHINNLISRSQIHLVEGRIPSAIVEKMLFEREHYISLLEYASSHTCKRFNGTNANDRAKLLDYLELHDWYGVSPIESETLIIGTKRDLLFFEKDYVNTFDKQLESFFKYFGLSESEKIWYIIEETPGKSISKKYIRSFFQDYLSDSSITPSYFDFVNILLHAPDIPELTDTDIKEIFNVQMTENTKSVLVRFLNYVHQKEHVQYSLLRHNKRADAEASIPAYSDDTYIALSQCFFNPEYIAEHHMIESALDNHIYAEMWLYLTLFFTCGWRAQDVCTGWRYPLLYKAKDSLFGINNATLYEDLLNDRIPDHVYEDVCKYAMHCITLSGKLPSKNSRFSPNPLVEIITPELQGFYGLLTLIGESHRLRSRFGYMNPSRTATYQNKMNLRNFFGNEIWDILHGENILTRRLNKVFLQGVEKASRQNGYGGLLASTIASFARGHVNMNTIRSYLRDHNFTGETAEMVLYCMLERGVFGFEYYQTIVTAYPDAMRNLPMKEQNKLISEANVSPLQLEGLESGLAATISIQQNFLSGDEEGTLSILKNMLEISQGRGKGKDPGVYCLLRSENKVCPNAEYESCLANGCKHLIFTKYGYLPLLNILADYKDEASSGNKKAESVLYKLLIPRYQRILQQLIKDLRLDSSDLKGLRRIIEKELDE